MVKNFPTGTILFYVPMHENALEEAKQYCRENDLTPDDVKILKTPECVIVKKK